MTHSENRLSLEQVEEIMIELRNETSLTVISKDFGVSRALIQGINEGRWVAYRLEGVSYPIIDKKHNRIVEQRGQRYEDEEKLDEPFTLHI